MVPLAERSMWSKNSFLERGTAFEKRVRLNSKFVQKCTAFLDRNTQSLKSMTSKNVFLGLVVPKIHFGTRLTFFKTIVWGTFYDKHLV
jgi:hypothetical protein